MNVGTGYTEEQQNTDWETASAAADYVEYDYYDQCGFVPDWTTEGSADATSTGWTTAFKYNAIIYMMLMIFTSLMLLCMIIPGVPPAFVSGAAGCVICLGTPMLAGGILSAVRVNSDLGTACSANIVNISSYDFENPVNSSTFLENGALLRLLFIMQFVFLCPMQCCALCGGGIGTVVLTAAKMQDDGYHKM